MNCFPFVTEALAALCAIVPLVVGFATIEVCNRRSAPRV